MVVASPGNLCKINLNKRQRLRHFLNHKGIRSRFKCTSQSCAYIVSIRLQIKLHCHVSRQAFLHAKKLSNFKVTELKGGININ